MNPKPILPGPTVVSEKAYTFSPPVNSRFWPWFFGMFLARHLRDSGGIHTHAISGLEKIQESLRAGHGILIAPNHVRPSDPMSMGLLVQALKQNINIMASAHLFFDSRFHAWLMPRLGAFSLYREGLDRESLKMAVHILTAAERPLIVFPEGVVTRTNDRLIALQEGTAFIARSAAKQRATKSPGAKVVVHPLALRYTFKGNLNQELGRVLNRIELRIGWQAQQELALRERVIKLGLALLALKEMEYFGAVQGGSFNERMPRLLEQVLGPLESEWLKTGAEGNAVERVKVLRRAILPRLVSAQLAEPEKKHIWKCLYDLEIAQQIYHYPPDYISENPSAERLIETVARYEEALGVASPEVIGPLHLQMDFGDAIVVDTARPDRHAPDPLLEKISESLSTLLGLNKQR